MTSSNDELPINFYHNKVYLNVNRVICDEDVDMFLQERGGDVIEAKYGRDNSLLEVDFVKNRTKQEILKRKTIVYRMYQFQVVDFQQQDVHAGCAKIANRLVFENLSRNGSLSNIAMYINFLVRNNTILRVQFSDVLENIAYVEFKDSNLKFHEIKAYLTERPAFRNNLVQIHEAYETNAVLMKIKNAKVKQFVNYLNKSFKIAGHCYWQVPFDYDDSPFIIIKFVNTLAKHRFLSGFMASGINDVFIENCFNITKLNEYLAALSENYSHNQPCLQATNEANPTLDTKKRPYFISSILSKMKKGSDTQRQRSSSHSQSAYRIIKKRNRKKNYPKKCELCPYIAYQSLCLQLHMKGHENKTGFFKCRFCNFNSELHLAIQNHESLHIAELESQSVKAENIFA